MALSNLSKCLVTPFRLASILKWKQSESVIMALDISSEWIGVALAKIQEQDNYSTYQIDPMVGLLNPCQRHDRAFYKDKVLTALSQVVKENSVRGFLVGWPLLPDARPGLECGQVLYLLDHLANQSCQPIIRKSRPLALWDKRSISNTTFENDPIVYVSSPNDRQLSKDGFASLKRELPPAVPFNSSCAEMILDQFLNSHFMQLNKRDESQVCCTSSPNLLYSLDDYDNGVYSQSLLT